MFLSVSILVPLLCQKNCDIDIKRQMRKFYAKVNLLLRRFSKCSTPVKCYLYKTYCSNLYCAPLWYNSTVTAMKKLKLPITALDDYFAYLNITVLAKCV